MMHLNIDGQDILVPNHEEWESLRTHPFIDGIPLFVLDDLVWRNLEVTLNYPDQMFLGLGYPLNSMDELLPCVFLKFKSDFQRVHIETLTCKSCGWRGKTANPYVRDIYLGEGINQKDVYLLMRAVAEKHPNLPCPNCGAKLPRDAIWVEPIAQ